MSLPTIYRALAREREKRGIQKGIKIFVDDNAISAMRNSGMTYDEIMDETGLSETSLIARLRKLGFISSQ